MKYIIILIIMATMSFEIQSEEVNNSRYSAGIFYQSHEYLNSLGYYIDGVVPFDSTYGVKLKSQIVHSTGKESNNTRGRDGIRMDLEGSIYAKRDSLGLVELGSLYNKRLEGGAALCRNTYFTVHSYLRKITPSLRAMYGKCNKYDEHVDSITVGLKYYPVKNSVFTGYVGFIDLNEYKSIRIEYQPHILRYTTSIELGLYSMNSKYNTTISVTRYFGKSNSLMNHDRRM